LRALPATGADGVPAYVTAGDQRELREQDAIRRAHRSRRTGHRLCQSVTRLKQVFRRQSGAHEVIPRAVVGGVDLCQFIVLDRERAKAHKGLGASWILFGFIGVMAAILLAWLLVLSALRM
jgi:hypothetical protein